MVGDYRITELIDAKTGSIMDKHNFLLRNWKHIFFYRYGEIGYKYNSGRKLAQNVSKTGPKFATSSAKKKVVMNSTSEAENVVPTDWDASAIVPPGQVQSNKGKS